MLEQQAEELLWVAVVVVKAALLHMVKHSQVHALVMLLTAQECLRARG